MSGMDEKTLMRSCTLFRSHDSYIAYLQLQKNSNNSGRESGRYFCQMIKCEKTVK